MPTHDWIFRAANDAAEPEVEPRRRPRMAPGRRTLTQQLPVQRRATATGAAPLATEDVHAAAAHGTRGAGTALPFLDQIQAAFGAHDVRSIVAHVDADAAAGARAMGAEAFAVGSHVAFAGAPDLHTAAHEAAHVIQQRAGVHLSGGVGAEHDAYERHADAVADAVVAGRSAEALLELEAATAAPAVQRKITIRPLPKSGPGRSIDHVLQLIRDGNCSPLLRTCLQVLSASPLYHLVIEFEAGKAGDPHYGRTAIRMGGADAVDPLLLQEQVQTDPWQLLLTPELTIAVTVRIAEDADAANMAATVLHELELHAVPAVQFIAQMHKVRSGCPNLDHLVRMVFEFMKKPDEHGDLGRLEAYVRSAAQIAEVSGGTPWGGWARAVRARACADAVEQLSAVALAGGEHGLEKVQYLTALIEQLEGGRAPLPPRPPSSGFEAQGSGPRPSGMVDVARITELIGKLVQARTPLENVIETMFAQGVPREMTIDIYNNAIVPRVAAAAPPKASIDDLVKFMCSFGIPLTVVVGYLERKEDARRPTLPYGSELEFGRRGGPDARVELRTVKTELGEFTLNPDETLNDGDCLFSSVIALGAHQGRTVSMLRRRAREGGGRPAIVNDGEWAHLEDIEGLARSMGLRIVVIALDLDYRPMQINVRGDAGDTIYIAQIFGGHFVPLRRR